MPARIPPLQISAYTATSAVGVGKEPLAEALEHSRSGLRANDFGPAPLPTWIGRVDGLEEIRLPEAFAHWDCRNNRLAWLGLRPTASSRPWPRRAGAMARRASR